MKHLKPQQLTLEYMCQIGQIKGSKELGKKYRGRFQYLPCPECGKPHWVALASLHDQKVKGLCRSCVSKHIGNANKHRIHKLETKQNRSLHMRGSQNPSWKGGTFVTGGGYIELYLYPEDFYFPMADKNHRVKEHRLVMAKSLGRCLHSWEIVHHKHTMYPAGSREDKGDNRLENLQLVTDDRHKQITILEQKVDKIERDLSLLKKYILTLGDEIICNAPIAVMN